MSLPTQAQLTTSQNSRIPIVNQASYQYSDGTGKIFRGFSEILSTERGLFDPLGRILGCGGELLPDYTGFSIGVYETNPNDATGTELGRLVDLTRTEFPDVASNRIPGGKAPNTENLNPYFLQNNPSSPNLRGTYNFLLDPNKGQTQPGKTYILVVNPPANSVYQQRRIRIRIGESTGEETGVGNAQNRVLRYLATSLDGQPIRLTGETEFVGTVVAVADAELQGLDLLAFEFTTNLCQPNQVQIIKAGDRATAEPGDTAIYRLSLRNLVEVGLNNVIATDTLPLGFRFQPKIVRGEINGEVVEITSEINGRNIIFRANATLPPASVLNIVYGAQITPDALRGSGINSAVVSAERVDNRFRTQDGPANHKLQLRPGIISDCGTIIGRVFVDKNFDGEQQANEPGIPNAVIYMENGNRVTTDVNGLFSVANVLPGSHTGVLDLSSLPGYTLAPNRYFKERNSQSRLVRIAPGGTVRMNFAVTPTFQEDVKK
ncbi:hypothetical protein [Calothrix sp. UHCC 0171]|uniref:DUF11 domain-containing protein n=1 Tax=Calothrix sp. UHCC 0171 TaxID=3110245 RepID=UPI002B20B0D4|nr:hypothetical protein [Calothrix sp. UHCC 0171]MEA5572539.1 hypothetical protein [Calothrix sp. UHCC 0171]